MQTYTPTPDFYNDYICHYGVKGMHWGIRKQPNRVSTRRGKKTKSDYLVKLKSSKKKPKTMDIPKSDSAVTKRVKNDWNTMSDVEFKNKYGASKKVYERRVQKYGDPYMNSPMAKYAKKKNAKKADRYERRAAALRDPYR